MKAPHLAVLVVAGGLFATSIVYAGKSVVWLTRDREQASVHGEIGRDLRGVVVRAAVSGSQLDLGTLDRTLVFVFDTSCTACDANMANWISVLADLQEDGVSVPVSWTSGRLNQAAFFVSAWRTSVGVR